MLTLWTVEGTGGGCTADVARLSCDRTGIPFVVVVTDGNLCAFTLPDPAESIVVGVYRESAWSGDDDDRDALAVVEAPLGVWDDGVWVAQAVDFVGLLSDALGEAGLTVEDQSDIRRLADALKTSAGLYV